MTVESIENGQANVVWFHALGDGNHQLLRNAFPEDVLAIYEEPAKAE